MVIEQINREDVLDRLCQRVTVYRLNTETDSLANLKSYSINKIISNLESDNYVYFTVKVSE